MAASGEALREPVSSLDLNGEITPCRGQVEHARAVPVIPGMTNAELSVLGWGVGLLFAYGVIHLGGLEFIRKARPDGHEHSSLGLLFTFWGLALLHMVEITVAAALLAYLLSNPDYGSLSNGFGSSAADYLYFAGISFATLGYTEIEARGAIRLLVMLLSLSGFMLITWSASFIYTVWGETFRD
jgi:hypothetical protein